MPEQTIAIAKSPEAVGSKRIARRTVSLRLPKLLPYGGGQLFQNMFCENVAAAELKSVVHQLKKYVFAFLTDRCYVFHLHNQFPIAKVCSCVLARRPYLGCPGRNEFTFYKQSTLSVTVDE